MRYQKYTFIIFLIVISVSFIQSENETAFFENQDVLKNGNGIGAYAIPNIGVTPKGTVLLFATARHGDNHDWGNLQRAVLLRSTDNGNSWEAPKMIAGKARRTVRMIGAMIDPVSGKITVFGHQSPLLNDEGNRMSEIWHIENPQKMIELGGGFYKVESNDDGQTWSEMMPVDLPYFVYGMGIVLKYGEHKGRFVLPARTNLSEEFNWDYMHNGVIYSDDQGKTWQAGGLSQSHVGECTIAELSDGSVYINNRNHDENYGIRNFAISRDGGESFYKFGSHPELIEPVCHAGMIRYSDPEAGNVILFSNPAKKAAKTWDSPSRVRMTVRASYDDCQTWPIKKLVYPGPSAYSSLAVGKNGMIFLAYERNNKGSAGSRENIAVARFNMAWLLEPGIEPPQITPQSTMFDKTISVSISAPEGGDLHYTIDGSDPTPDSPVYSGEMQFNETTKVKAIVFGENGQKSFVAEEVFEKSRIPAPNYTHAYHTKYPGSGKFTLLDGKYGTLNYADGRWQGFEYDDFEVVLDRGEVKLLEKITANFLEDTNSWIFFPESVIFAISDDGEQFTTVDTFPNVLPATELSQATKKVGISPENLSARYVKITAKNIRTCPSWHPGNGGGAWVFVDEIEIF